MNGWDWFTLGMFLILFGLMAWFAIGYLQDWREKRRRQKAREGWVRVSAETSEFTRAMHEAGERIREFGKKLGG